MFETFNFAASALAARRAGCCGAPSSFLARGDLPLRGGVRNGAFRAARVASDLRGEGLHSGVRRRLCCGDFLPLIERLRCLRGPLR